MSRPGSSELSEGLNRITIGRQSEYDILGDSLVTVTTKCEQLVRGPALAYYGAGLEFFGNKYFCGERGAINKWPQGMVEIQPILR